MEESTALARALPVVATLVAPHTAETRRTGHGLRVAGPQYPDLESLLAAAAVPDAVVLVGRDPGEERDWLAALRRDSRFGLRPLLATHEQADPDGALSDGLVRDPGEVFRTLAGVESSLAALPQREYADGEERLLAFLYSRSGRHVLPARDWRAEHCYRYPLLDAMAPPGVAGIDWVPSLRHRSLLEPVDLVDRTRECASCGSAHLNYVDVCPECRALDLRETIFLHCYTCGHVAAQEDYLQGDRLRCRKCQAQLRHIGVDYDRALETFSCAPCGARFAEPEVQARCYGCGRVHATVDVIERRIESFRLSDAGSLAARTGNIGDLFALIDDMNCAHPAYFEQTLDWMLKLRVRHPELHFGLVCIQLSNLRELIETLSRVNAVQLVDSFATRLRELVRPPTC